MDSSLHTCLRSAIDRPASLLRRIDRPAAEGASR